MADKTKAAALAGARGSKACECDSAGELESTTTLDAATQRARLLAMLRRGLVSTLDARAVGIMHPGGRIMELRHQGHPIVTYRHPRRRYGIYALKGRVTEVDRTDQGGVDHA